RGRGRGGAARSADADAEAVPAPVAQATSEAPERPDPPEAVAAPAVQTVAVPTALPAARPVADPQRALAVVEAAAPVAVERGPDPAEISAPPAAPRRGWWRRGA
ncbi:MAG: ribonuclease E/G, partial [Caulobacteraceae bacterium]